MGFCEMEQAGPLSLVLLWGCPGPPPLRPLRPETTKAAFHIFCSAIRGPRFLAGALLFTPCSVHLKSWLACLSLPQDPGARFCQALWEHSLWVRLDWWHFLAAVLIPFLRASHAWHQLGLLFSFSDAFF